MRKKPVMRRLVGTVAAVAISFGVAAPVGLTQDDPYGEEPPPVVTTPGGTIGIAPSAPETSTSAQLKQCIKKAKKKFRNDPAKKKNAIKKCKKKYA